MNKFKRFACIICICILTILSVSCLAQKQILVTNFGNILDGNGGHVSLYSPPNTSPVNLGDVNSAHNIAFDKQGHIYVSDHFAGRVYKFNADGSGGTMFAGVGTPRGATGMVFDSLGRLFVTDFNDGRIFRYDSDGTGQTVIASGLSGPDHITIHNGHLYAAMFISGAVQEFTQTGDLVRTIPTNADGAVGIDFDSDGRLYVSGFNDGTIRRLNSDGSTNTIIASGLSHPHGVLIGPDNKLYVVEQGQGRVLKFNLDGSNPITYIEGLNNPVDFKLKPNSTYISGNLNLDGISANAGQTNVSFSLRPIDGSETINRTVAVSREGDFALLGLPLHRYSVLIVAPRYLQASLDVDASAGSVSGLSTNLLAGDIDGNNSIDLADLIDLLNIYGTSSGDSTYETQPLADLNVDGRVDLTDLISLLNNYGANGDQRQKKRKK